MSVLTMSVKKEELRQEIWRIWEILIYAKECFQYCLYLYKPNTKEEVDYISFSQDFKFFRDILWERSIIELSKLFSSSKSHRFNLKNFIGKLKKTGQFGKFGITDLTIKKWEDELISNGKIIENILIIRDKLYAHSDSQKHDYLKIGITFFEVEKLIGIAESVIKEIYLTAFEAGIDMSTVIFDKSNFEIIRILAEEKRKGIQEILGTNFEIKK